MSSKKKGLDIILATAEYVTGTQGFDQVLRMIKITDGGDGRAVGEFTVAKEHLNRQGTLHGGLMATIVDICTTYALMSKGSHPGVTANLNICFTAPAHLGEVIQLDCNTVRAGKKMAYLDCLLTRKSDGKVIAKGGQVKYIQFDKKKLDY
ncbi:acyl-coenzyme A thioesterase 13 [Drosophila rhopaloa]|uniref:Thioesterase domain-containing protein n=1 Tax=Drosophila rhopaloa TaxID=1041015 RepID=A0ABM5GW26_DRORH|nr:acyl-coenzyme A thioesterase 13 [Drosophila rhopaloa]